MDPQILKQIRWLKGYALLSTAAFAVLFLSAALPNRKISVDEIDAQRINIREKNGTIRLALANNDRFPGGSEAGVELNFRNGKRPGAGLLFFNDEGDEVGGIVYEGKMVDGKPVADGTIRFDHFRQNEAIGISYSQRGTEKESGLQVWDQPNTLLTADLMRQYVRIQAMKDGPEKTEAMKALMAKHAPEIGGFTERVFVGRTKRDEAAVLLMDTNGKPRIRMAVDSANVASLQFLDDKGAVVYSLPAASTKP